MEIDNEVSTHARQAEASAALCFDMADAMVIYEPAP